LILHATDAEEWAAVREQSEFWEESLAEDGAIHCSLPEDVPNLANAAGLSEERDLVLLCIDTDRVESEVAFESDGREPRILGPLDADAIVAVSSFPTDERGTYYLPEKLVERTNGGGATKRASD
jgi:uncharacterized protein (DUF952 family)